MHLIVYLISVLKSDEQLDAHTVLLNFEALKVVIGGTCMHTHSHVCVCCSDTCVQRLALLCCEV